MDNKKFLNHYECLDCVNYWNNESDHTCNDRCEYCGIEMQPIESIDLNPTPDFELPIYGIKVFLHKDVDIGGWIESDFDKEEKETIEEIINGDRFRIAYDSVCSVILALACSGLDIKSQKFVTAFEVAFDNIINHYGDD